MSEDSESSGTKSVPILVQSEGAFNAGIQLTETNYDVWYQLMEMHIAEREKLSYIMGKSAHILRKFRLLYTTLRKMLWKYLIKM